MQSTSLRSTVPRQPVHICRGLPCRGCVGRASNLQPSPPSEVKLGHCLDSPSLLFTYHRRSGGDWTRFTCLNKTLYGPQHLSRAPKSPMPLFVPRPSHAMHLTEQRRTEILELQRRRRRARFGGVCRAALAMLYAVAPPILPGISHHLQV